MADTGIRKPTEKELGLRDSSEAEKALEKVVGQVAALKYTGNRETARFLEGYFEGILWCYSRPRGRLGIDLERALKDITLDKPDVEGAPAPSGALGGKAPVRVDNAPTTTKE